MSRRPVQEPSALWERLQALFDRAIHLQPAARAAFIRQETDGSPELRDELLAVLACDVSEGTGPLSRAIGSAVVDAMDQQPRTLLGHLVGSYRLALVLGQGGTGTVYMGERADSQYSGQVAVKVVDSSAIRGNFGERFRAERQILATLDHPNIARLLDAGETESGQPYLVMEYVRGQALDRYCDEKRIDIQQRLRLFDQICGAVQYAHQNLIVHRDLKPANILVTEDGVPKLLDFGIAKLLRSGEALSDTEVTRLNDRLLTPEYASPEQILGSNITTASDVYSLGVILYQLMCGVRPYKVPSSGSQLELERSICISDPERPSMAVCRSSEAAAIAEARDCTPERLSRQLKGDIDSIVLRALRKEPDHRYSSVEQFASDIRRYLGNEPVHARQGNWIYYAQRFARRHTVGVLTSTAFLAFVIGVAIVMSIQRQQISVALKRATEQGQRAETVSEFMLNVFRAADPFVNFGKEPTARHLLEQAARRIHSDLDQQPQVRARLLEAIGGSYRRMGHPDRAVGYLEEALRLERSLSANGARLGSVLAELAIAQRETGKYEDSDRTFAEALSIMDRSDDLDSEVYVRLLVDLGRLELFRSNTEQARLHLTRALEIIDQFSGTHEAQKGEILADLANVYVWENDFSRAEQTARRAVALYARVPETHPDRVMADFRLAEILLFRNRLDEAEPIFERTLVAQRLIYGSQNAAVADTLASFSQLYIARGNYPAAEKLIVEALDIHRFAGNTIDPKVGYLQTILSTVLLKQSRHSDAEASLRIALNLFSASLPPDHQYVASAEYYLGESLLGQGKLSDAEAVLLASMNRWKRTDAPAWRVARSKNALGEVLYRQGRVGEAEQALVSTFRELTADQGADMDAKERARERVARFYTQRGEAAKFAQLEREVADHVAQVSP